MSDTTQPALQIFHGEANSAAARLYVRIDCCEPNTCLAGEIIGPFCEYARTLSARIPLVDHGGAPSALAEAIIPDPCFWTPELPFLYRARIELKRGTTSVAEIEQSFGIRRLATSNNHLLFDGQRWVLRAVDRSLDERAPWDAWRAQSTTCMVRAPDDALLRDASRFGVLIVAIEDAPARLVELARWPAVGIALFTHQATIAPEFVAAAPNLIVGRLFAPPEPVIAAPWSRIIAADAGEMPDLPMPRVACRFTSHSDLADARAECDRLQRDLAGRGEYAGYMILAQS
jgi:hypothetical protein